MAVVWQCGRYALPLKRPLVMGILNITPDSFSNGQQYLQPEAAILQAQRLIDEGADIIDIGAESTRPGAQTLSASDEVKRLMPVIEALLDCGLPLSVDTFKPSTMQHVLDAGVDIINDIYGFRQPGAVDVVAGYNCGLCVMHMQGEPRTMQEAPHYNDVVADVRHFLYQRTQELQQSGVVPNRIALDPGFGFGKTAAHNYELLKNFKQLHFEHYPWLVALSRKSMIGHITGREPAQRLGGSIAGALAGVVGGAKVLRVHDVAATVDAVKVWQRVFGEAP